MAEKTDEQIAKDNSTTIDALSVYLDDVAPAEQFGSNPLYRIGNIQPIQSQEDLFERGLIGEDGLLTPKGDLYQTLSDNGLINPDGTLPEKSAAFMMDEDDALKPENLDAYVIRRENKIGEKPMSWGDTFGGLGELLWDAGAGLGTMVKLGIQNIGVRDIAYTDPLGFSSIPASEEKLQEIQKRKDQLLNRSSIAATSFVENSIKAFSETGAIVNLAGAAVLGFPSRILGDSKNADELLNSARQAQDRLIESNKDASIGSTLDLIPVGANELVNAARQAQDRLIKSNQDAIIGSTLDAVFKTTTYVEEMARVKSEMPKAEFDKIIKQTGAAGQIFADPVELAKIGTVMKLATRPIVSRLTLNAERVIGKASDRAARLAEINVEIADLERAKGMTQNAAELARRTADAARERFDLNGDQLLLQRANAAEEIFNRSTAKVGRFTDDGVRLANEAAELTAETQKLASRIPVAAAQAFEATAKTGRELKAVPFKAFAATIEPVSRGLIALDDGLDAVSKKLGIGAAYDIMTSKVGQAVGYGAAIGLGPAPALIGAAGSVLKSGPFLQRLADTSRILGTEMAKAQSQVPFFQRVANNPMISPAHRSLAHLSDLATLGGFLPNITRRAAKGAALSFPIDFAAQYMSDGGEINQNTFKQAFAESVLIGGSSAALGGMFAGTKKRHRDLAVNDEINFRNEITAPDQKRLFTSAPPAIRRAVGTFSAVFPSVNIQFTQEGGGFHDDNTIGIDLNSSNPLKYLLAHEVKHLLVHRNQMHTPIVAMMLGDGEAGGIMRAPDGTLNPEFEAFAREYNNRQIAAGRAPVSLGKIAEEFFVEAGVEDMARMSESGELGAIASRTEARRMIGRLFNSVFDKSTVLKDFHLRIGGLMDQGGKLVQGNGLLNPGITQTQEMRNMTRNMLKRAAGRSVGQFEPLGATEAGNKGEGPGINLPIRPDDKAMIEKIGPVEFEMETVNGRRQVVRDSDGNPVPVDFNTQLMRSRTGALIQEAIGNRPSTYQSSPNEMRLNDEGIWEGYLPPDIIEYIKKKGSLNQEQIRMIEHVNSMIKNFKGDVALVINHPATSRNKKGKLNYKTLKATLRQVVPISWNLTKDGNLTLGLMSVTQLKSNIDARISSRLGQQLYQGNRAKLMVDIGKVMELHQQGKRTDEYFDTEYGAAKSQQFKNFVNSVFGLMTKKQGEANPIFSEENLRGNGVYKTYRADRISQATKMTGDKYPFQYDFVVQNMMPNGLPTLDEQGRPVVMNRMPEPTRQMPEGYKSHHDETLLKSAWNGKELDLPRPFKASESLPSLAMRTKWEEKPLVNKDDFDFTEKARVVFGKNKNGEDVTIKYDPNLLNAPSIVDFANTYAGEQVQYTIADRMSAVDGDMGGALHPFLKNNDVIIEGPDGQKYVVGWGNNSSTVGTKMRRKAKDGAKVLMVYLMGNEAHQSNTRTVRLFDTQLENSSMPSHMAGITRAYSYIAIKEMRHQSALKEVERINGLIKKAKKTKKEAGYVDKLKSKKESAIKEAQKIKVSSYDSELAGIFRKIKTSQTRLNNGLGKQSTVDANIKDLSNFAASVKGKKLISEIPSKFIYEMTGTFDGRKSAVLQISNLKLFDFDGSALSNATSDIETGDKNAIVTAIDLSNDQDFFMLYMGNDPKQMSAMTASEKAAAEKLKKNNDFVIHEAYDTLILSPLDGRRNLNSRMENALDAVPDSFQAVLNDRPGVKEKVGKTNEKGNLILSEDNLLNTVRDQQTVPLIYNPVK